MADKMSIDFKPESAARVISESDRLEMVGPDPEIVAIVKTVMSQNGMILSMNARLLIAFGLPGFFGEKEKDTK